MKKICVYLKLVLCGVTAVYAQEYLSTLPFNPQLYRHAPAQRSDKPHKYLTEKKNFVVFTDTLQLPFSDDFSSNRLRSYKWLENHITDTFYNVTGTCLNVDGIETISEQFMTSTSWSYTYNTTTKSVDSTANAPIVFTFFGPEVSGCFSRTPQTKLYYPTYYTYTFDTNGRKLDSTKVTPDETVFYSPVVYFAQGQPGTLWTDNYAFVNTTYPVNPPTIGVATLDGLNEYGLPYNKNPNSYGSADMLTSKPIDFSPYSDTSNIYLSFFYQPMGLGDFPEKNDSLLVEFKDIGNIWRTVWADTGFSSEAAAQREFKEVLVKVPDNPLQTTYYHKTFQFRFRNKASLYGNNDHWHIDYVRLDRSRSDTGTIIRDIAFMYNFPSILKEYTHLPADQFMGVQDLKDSISLPVRNLDPDALNNPPATNFIKGAEETYPLPVVVATNTLETFNAAPYSFIGINPATEYNITHSTITPVDSYMIISKAYIQPNDSRPQNDTLYHSQNFSYLMAYDDGTAEKAYGISGLGLKKLAYEFELHQPDTLAGFQIMFAQVEDDVRDLVFNFHIWDSLKMNDFTFNDNPILTIENKKPLYIDSINGFATYVLDTPIILSGKFFFGWAQTDPRRLQVGYDLNTTLGKKHMYIYTNATWKPSTIIPAGSPMIRMIFDTDFWGESSYPTVVKNLTKDSETSQVTIYPNPTTGQTFIRHSDGDRCFEISVHNLTGTEIFRKSGCDNMIQLNSLSMGLYILCVKDSITGKTSFHKILKTSEH